MTGNLPFSVARVHILDLPYTADKCYDYIIPENLVGSVKIGSVVLVEFGQGGKGKKRCAIVTELAEKSEFDKLKPILTVASEEFSLTEELVGLCFFIAERTFSSVGEAACAILPTSATKELFKSRREPIVRFYSLDKLPGGVRLGPSERRAVEFIGDAEFSEADIFEGVGVSSTTLKNLVKKGILKLKTEEVIRNPYKDRGKITDDNVLSKAQQKAFSSLLKLALSPEPTAALLYGVTGSGKTRVIKSLIDKVIENGKSVIMLVPEISLTGQTVDLFCGFFGSRVAVIHSALSEGEKRDAWKRIRRGEVDVVIGTRSAVFAPLDNLGMIVIDEEQEHTYKSDMSPKYHTKDIARFRAAKNGALMLLASATPSLESFYKASTGTYSLVSLDERYGGAVLPKVIISDLREDVSKGKINPIGTTLTEEIKKNLENGEQSILFVGRRGYNNFVSCLKCGKVITCPRCSVSLTYHRGYEGDSLKCHYCGHTEPVPEKCPECASEHITRKGFGTQLVAEELGGLFPKTRILRLDADAASQKFSHDEILSKFREHEADILIGTQMVTKGHNFPDVTLVGVINADSALYLDDFRASERTFSLLTQVIGRAGRASKAGRAVIQTLSPHNETILLASEQNYKAFYESAIKLRRQLVFPPFSEFVVLGIHGEEEKEVLSLSLKLDVRLKEYATGDYNDVPMYIFGPFEAPIYKVNNVYRMRIVIKCQVTKRMRMLISALLGDFPKNSQKAAISVDVNPTSM